MEHMQVLPNLSTFGARFRAVSDALGLSDSDTADKIGMSRFSLIKWRKDAVTKPDKTALKKFCALTEVRLDWLVEGIGEVPKVIIDNPVSSKTKGRGPRTPPDTAIYAMTEQDAIAALGLPPEAFHALVAANVIPPPKSLYLLTELEEAVAKLGKGLSVNSD